MVLLSFAWKCAYTKNLNMFFLHREVKLRFYNRNNPAFLEITLEKLHQMVLQIKVNSY